MSNETTYNVFISYSWNYNKTLVNDLYRFLAKNGIRAWKDDEGGMAGSTIRSMQSGIKTATGMVICASDAYLDSPMCRLELDYSFQQQKPLTLVKLEKECDLRDDILLCNHLYIQDDNKDQLFQRILDDLRQKYFSEEDDEDDEEEEQEGQGLEGQGLEQAVGDLLKKFDKTHNAETGLSMVKVGEKKTKKRAPPPMIELIPFGIDTIAPYNAGIPDAPTEAPLSKETLERYLKRKAIQRARRWIAMGGFTIVFICMMGTVSLSISTVIGTLDDYPINMTSVFDTLRNPVKRYAEP